MSMVIGLISAHGPVVTPLSPNALRKALAHNQQSQRERHSRSTGSCVVRRSGSLEHVRELLLAGAEPGAGLRSATGRAHVIEAMRATGRIPPEQQAAVSGEMCTRPGCP